MDENLKVLFYLKREKKNEKNGNADALYPVVGKIIIGKTLAQFGTKLKVPERLWHVKSGRATGKSHRATELNREINKMNLCIHHHYREILERTGNVTAQEVKNAFQGIAIAQKTVLGLFEDMLSEFHSRIGIDRSIGTYRGYETAHHNLKRFILEKYKVRDMPLNRLDLPFIEAFDFYLRVERRMKPGSVCGNIVPLQQVVRIALRPNLLSRFPFAGFKAEKIEQQTRSLTRDEFERLMSAPLESTSLNFVRDMFVFASFTGISYIDLKNLTWKEIVTEEDGSLWISAFRQKTKVRFNVKLLDIPLKIIEKYRGLAKDNVVFRIRGLNRVNQVLKIIALNCGIDKPLTFHCARHTFASQICLSQGVPIETVSRMLGHRDIRTTQRYAHVDNTKIGNDMKRLSERIAEKYPYV
ncbi:MAG: site-specific integrase [Candidatus Symbiothrix sp.]|jgi:integrase|nr:site-specific integrase [Candidatus Symbiothrix sp.]